MNDEIRYQQIHKFFQRRHLLNDVSLSLQRGVATLLGGKNGSGKTTLLRILAGMEKPTQCSVVFNQKEPVRWSRCRKLLQQQVMYLHQQPYMFEGSVIHNLALALPRGLPAAQRKTNLQQALDWAQLSEVATTRAKTLSSGQMQRVSLARAWLRQAKILLLDEPIANMDKESCERTVALLKQFKETQTTLMIASHNHAIFDDLVDQYLNLEHGKLLVQS